MNKKLFYFIILSVTLLLIKGCGSLDLHMENSYVGSMNYDSATKSFRNSNKESNDKSTFELLSFLFDFLKRPHDIKESEGFRLLDPLIQEDSLNSRQITWIGHSTLLLTIDGVTILTDPVFSSRASPFSNFGPKRVTPPGLQIIDLPKIDAVIISHNHYDHLDIKSLQKLNKLQPHIRYFVPLGLQSLLLKYDLEFVYELDWWEKATFSGLTFIATPVNHWSSRSLFDRNKTLWSGWMVNWPNYSFYFAGDTGYSNDFIETRKRLGRPDLAAIPIGAYAPRYFMKQSHINPEEAVRVFEDLHANRAVAIHWGTYKLTTELLNEPPKRLRAEIKRKNIKSSAFIVLEHGQKLNL